MTRQFKVLSQHQNGGKCESGTTRRPGGGAHRFQRFGTLSRSPTSFPTRRTHRRVGRSSSAAESESPSRRRTRTREMELARFVCNGFSYRSDDSFNSASTSLCCVDEEEAVENESAVVVAAVVGTCLSRCSRTCSTGPVGRSSAPRSVTNITRLRRLLDSLRSRSSTVTKCSNKRRRPMARESTSSPSTPPPSWAHST